MPKTELTVKDSRKILATAGAWSTTGAAIRGFYTEAERADENDYFKNLYKLMEKNNYPTGREKTGAFLFMCMAGQKKEDGTPMYNMEDIYNPDKLHEEKVRLRQQLEVLLTPAPADATEADKDKATARLKQADTFFSDGVKRACERLSGYAEESVKNNDLTELMRPEAAVLSNLLVISLTNFVQNSYETVGPQNTKVLMANSLVSRLRDMNFDLEAQADNYVGMASFSFQLSQTMDNLNQAFAGKELSGLLGIEDYVGFAGVMDKYRKNPDRPLSEIFTSKTRKQILQRANEGQNITLEDYSPNELGYDLVPENGYLEDETEIDDHLDTKEAMGNYIKRNRNKPEIQRKKVFMEATRDIVFNSTDPEYIYGLAQMYMNGRLYPNTTYSAEIKLNNVSKNPDVKDYKMSFDKISINFDNVLDRKNVLKEAFLSDLDIEPYSFAPIDEENKEISEINEERSSALTELNNTIKGLKPRAGASREWKEMLFAVNRAKKISEDYQKNYAALEAGATEADVAKRQAALEKVTSAMELARDAAHNYVVHKLDSGKYTDGKDYQRLKAAKKLENLGKQQCNYLNPNVAEKLNQVHEDKGYFNEASMKADIENIGRYTTELFNLGQKTTFISDEFKTMMHSIRQLQQQQNEISNNKEYNVERDTLYFGGPDENGAYRKGYVERAIERIDEYIAHRKKEGIEKDLYADRVDVAGRLKRYLQTIKAGAARTREDRLSDHEYNKAANAHKDAFKKKYDAAKQVLIDNYTTIRDEVSADKLPAVKDAICTIYAYQKYKNEMDAVSAGNLEKSEASYVLKVERGAYDDIIRDFKEKQSEKDSYLNRNAQKTSFIKDILKENTFGTVIQEIDRDIADRKPISEDETFKSTKFHTENAIANCRTTANEMSEGEMDASFLSKFIVQRSMLDALDDIAKLPAKDETNQKKLANLLLSTDELRTNNTARKISSSVEIEAIIDRYSGQKNLGDKLETMYQDYALLKVHTATHDGDLPEDVDKYLQEARNKKTEVKEQQKGPEKVQEQAPLGLA